jgi:hypothetical protein
MFLAEVMGVRLKTENRGTAVAPIRCHFKKLSPSSHKFDDKFIPSGLSAEGANTVFVLKDTSPYMRIEALRYYNLSKIRGCGVPFDEGEESEECL